MNILFDAMGTQVQTQGAMGGRLNTLFAALTGAGYTMQYTNYPLPIKGQLEGMGLFVVLTHYCTQVMDPPGVSWPQVIPSDADCTGFTWSCQDLTDIQGWVHGGGGLLLVSSHSFFTPNDAALAAMFDIDIVPAYFKTGDGSTLVMTPTSAWPTLTAGVSTVQAWDSCGIAGKSGSGAEVIVPFPAGTAPSEGYDATQYAFAVATTYDQGNVVVVGHSGIAGDEGSPWPSQGQITYGDNAQFLFNCISYLSGGPLA